MPPSSAEAETHPARDQLPRRDAWLLAGILLVYLALGAAYSVVNPVLESPDEVRHYPYVKHLADGRGLPVQGQGDAAWEQEGSQPPLYYALAAALTFWIDTDDLDEVRTLNPHVKVGEPGAPDNKNILVHGPAEAFPWHGAVLAIHLVRGLSLLLGAGTILCTCALARTLFPQRRGLALGAAALNAFLPMFVFLSSSVNNDNLVTLLSSLALLMLARCATGEGRLRGLAPLGVVLGLACLAKLSALALLPLAALVLAIWHQRTWRAGGSRDAWGALWRFLGDGLRVGLPVLAIAGWWYLRNLLLYGDPTGLSAMLSVVGGRMAESTLADRWREFIGLAMSFWGVFGAFNVLMRPVWIYQVLHVLGLMGLGGCLWACVRARRGGWNGSWVLAIPVLWVGMVSVSLARWTTLTMGSQGRLLFPALAPLCIGLALGWSAWFPRRVRAWAPALGAGLLLALSAVAPSAVIAPAYARPRLLSPADIPASARPVRADLGEGMRLLAYEAHPADLAAGEDVSLTLYWECLRPMDADYSVFVHLLGANARIIGQSDSYPGGGTYPTSQWEPGAVFADRYVVRAAESAIPTAQVQVAVGAYDLAAGTRLPILDAQGTPAGDRCLLAALPFHASGPAVWTPAGYQLGDDVALEAYALEADHAIPGTPLVVWLRWRALRDVQVNYSVFAHLLGADGQPVAHQDNWPQDGGYPTALWRAGEVVEDRYALVVDPAAAPGACALVVGMYDQALAYLPVVDGSGIGLGTRANLCQVMVTTAR
ncbi:MAG: glycosyltransferase family 39 protein [Anaerolineae bacterium]